MTQSHPSPCHVGQDHHHWADDLSGSTKMDSDTLSEWVVFDWRSQIETTEGESRESTVISAGLSIRGV